MSSNPPPGRPLPTSPPPQSGDRYRSRRHSSQRRHSATRDRRPSDAYSPRSPEAPRPVRGASYRGVDEPANRTPRRRGSSQTPAYRPSEKNVFADPQEVPTPYSTHDRDPMGNTSNLGIPGNKSEDLVRKKSLVKPERRRKNPDDPNYYYRQHAQKMNVMPSSTGNDPQLEEDLDTLSSQSAELKNDPAFVPLVDEKKSTKLQSKKLSRKATFELSQEEQRKRIQEAPGAITLWSTYCHLITFWMPNALLRCMGKRMKEQQRAWREKIGLISIILVICTLVGYLTFGFTQTVCPDGSFRLRVNQVGGGYLIVHGQAYDLTRSKHPLARGVPDGANVLFDLEQKNGGKDASFMFQNVNGKCKGLIQAASGSDVPTDSSKNLAWYFPCNLYNQDGSSKPNMTFGNYLGFQCHTSNQARNDFYSLRSNGDVYYTWADVKNTSRNLVVYSGDVLDLDLLAWFNKTQVTYPSQFDKIRTDTTLRGNDITLAFSGNPQYKQYAQCFQEILRVGSVDTETVGCIASKVVLYVSLIFILAIVVTKFVLALLFQWFLCRRYAAEKTSMSGTSKHSREKQIEDWSEDIYRPPPKFTEGSGTGNKRSSFLPTTSRFTSPYAIDRALNKNRPPPTTMASQNSTLRLLAGANRSDSNLLLSGDAKQSMTTDDRMSIARTERYSTMPSEETSGPQGFIHEAVVPQPPPEWQPFGFPLAHTVCLVTAYSEGPAGIRSTLDSVAMTDYPNSHKLLFVVCDGLIKGKGESMSTPEACLSMMKDLTVLPDEVAAFSYVAVAAGSKRHNMAKVYSGFYDYGVDSIIPVEKQQRVPMVLIVKCGTPAEATAAKPGNRGKRDSQIILMSFLQKVMFDERMTELEYEMFNGIWKITGISPDFYEIVLMVDADTKVFPDSLTHMVSAMVKDPEIMGLCGETKIANKTQSWVSMIQVFEYFISHHLSKSFESVFGGVTCLPGCFCMYRIKTPKGGQNYWVPILANPDIVEHYSENVVDTLHKKNLLLLGEDRYLSTLMLKTFPKRKQVFVPQAVCKTTVPDTFKVLLSQRRRWINSTVHNLMELVLVRDLCGTFCFSMQFVIFIELIGTLVLPAAISFTVYVLALGIKAAITHTEAPVIPLILLLLILGLPGVLIVMTAHRPIYIVWMLIYLLSLPIWNLVLPVYAFWHFDDFSWGDTRKTSGGDSRADKAGHGGDGEFDSSQITMKRWGDFESERRLRGPAYSAQGPYSNNGSEYYAPPQRGHVRQSSALGYSETIYSEY